MASQCKFWLPKKNRYCANIQLRNSSYCGNHTQRSDGKWVPCPIDPSHSVLEENLESHLKRCPLLKQAQSLSTQHYYRKGINDGNEDEDEQLQTSTPNGGEDTDNITSAMKRNAVYAMTLAEFRNLINRIKSIHASICNDIQESFKNPEACLVWTNRQVDEKLPFQEKHVLQQASILGNLEDVGALANFKDGVVKEQFDDTSITSAGLDDIPAVVEFGAGRGYLTQMLADCYGINKVILVERKSYKLKADRSLRQKKNMSLERLRIDIGDLELNAVDSLKGVSYLAIGKHLCGPATDLTLRCCMPKRYHQYNAKFYLKGLAIATCCHHLCQWKHYINKSYMLNLGLAKAEFHAISWFTSWAVDSDHGSRFRENDYTSMLQLIDDEKCSVDMDPCGVGHFLRNMKTRDRATLGFMCKDIIDAGRLMWLKEQGLESKLVNYVPSTISPENHLLIAGQRSNALQ